MSPTILGIDLGSKKSGTTAICYFSDTLKTHQCPKSTDADHFLQDCIQEVEPDEICIDAPLSLPAAYYDSGNDFFYRESDRQLGGMSPMFLGGLTARAIKLAKQWRTMDIEVLEVYPAYIGKEINHSGYRGSGRQLENFNHWLSERLEWPVHCSNWHEIDAVLAWWTGQLKEFGAIEWIGDPEEGRIAVIPDEYLSRE